MRMDFNFNVPSQAQLEAINNVAKPTASDTMAEIHREQWEDWKNRYQSRLIDLANQAQSGELTRKDIQRADQSVTSAFSGQRDSIQKTNSGLGIQPTAQQKESSDRALGLAEASGRVGARNQARIAGEDRDMQILAGGGNIGLGM
ncbi:hypothetical protein NFC81_09045 [Salinispirillum sp. LH 10-3-1]|uniref:Uncharacterized protein n=1 Tax=Salinispirillum sp. LH 10-3-1 TaxID=2952525 RepID=A0AB38YBY0_9GAMM